MSGDDEQIAAHALAARRREPIGPAALHQFHEPILVRGQTLPEHLLFVGRIDGDRADRALARRAVRAPADGEQGERARRPRRQVHGLNAPASFAERIAGHASVSVTRTRSVRRRTKSEAFRDGERGVRRSGVVHPRARRGGAPTRLALRSARPCAKRCAPNAGRSRSLPRPYRNPRCPLPSWRSSSAPSSSRWPCSGRSSSACR